jgi:hypothetical protein
LHLIVRVLLTLACLMVNGCGPSPVPTPSPPLPNPVILSQALDENWFTHNVFVVSIRNDGADGMVQVEVYTFLDKGHLVRGESGVGKAIRQTFTQDVEPPPVHRADYEHVRHGIQNIEFKSGETKTVKIPLVNYNWSNMFNGEDLKVTAEGIDLPKPP